MYLYYYRVPPYIYYTPRLKRPDFIILFFYFLIFYKYPKFDFLPKCSFFQRFLRLKFYHLTFAAGFMKEANEWLHIRCCSHPSPTMLPLI